MTATQTELKPAAVESHAVIPVLLKPIDVREFTPRAVIVGMLVAAVVGASYPYVVMKLGFGPNISVVSAFFGFLALGIFSRTFNRWENNIVQTAGTSAGSTAFLCVLMAAFDMLRQDPSVHFAITLTPMMSFAWLTTAGLLGVLLAVPMRRHYVVEEQLTFADGVAAAETLTVLDARGAEGKAAARSMFLGTALSGVLMTIRADARLLGEVWYRVPELLPFGRTGQLMNVGVSWSLLSLGSGMLVGLRISTSMLLGAIAAWVIAPPLLVGHGMVPHLVRREVLLWVMWPGTGMLIAGGLTALFLRWRLLVKTFRQLSTASIGGDDFPMRWVVIGVVICTIAVAVVQHAMLGMPVWMTLAACVLSLLLMLVGLRVLGETNWGPVSALSNMMQAVFGVLAPGQVGPNMVASGVTGSIASQSEGLMQDYKTGHLIGSTPRYLTYAQLLAVPVGALTVSYVYPLLRDTYGLGGDTGLQSPISQKWAGFAKLLSAGFAALPPGAIVALIISVVLGVIFTLLEATRWKKWTPSPTGVGIGILVPGSAIVSMFLGAVVSWVWEKASPQTHERNMTPVASGFIAGEAIVAVIIPVLVTLGWVALH
jgi:putative OPT family oligopeptide transporter